MITEYVDRFQEIKQELLEYFSKEEPSSYEAILEKTLEFMFPNKDYGDPDYSNIHIIDDGDYQGTLIFVIPEYGYQPYKYWSVKVAYGSCSGCDTYRAYSTWGEDPQESAPHMLTMAMHMIQSIKEL